MNYDEFWAGGPRFLHTSRAFAPGTDAFLLADFAERGKVRRVCDLGCGCGIVGILLGWEHPERQVTGVEISPQAAAIARENGELNGLTDRFTVVEGDLREHRTLLPAGSFDLTVANPPYFSLSGGKRSATAAQARQEESCTLAQVCAAAAWLTRWGGRFAVIHRPERLAELLGEMTRAGLEPKRLRLVQPRGESAPGLVLAEGRRGGKPGLKVEPPLLLCGEDGGESPELRRIYRR